MRIAVTGALGVNGAWIVRSLVESGHSLLALDVRKDWSLLPDLEGQVEFAFSNVADIDGLKRAIAGSAVDVIVHLAVIVPDSDPFRAFEVNAQGSVNVYEVAREVGVRRVVYTSSRAVYGLMTGSHRGPTYEPVTEDEPRAPLPAMRTYAASKTFGEEAGLAYAEAYGLEFAALRFATIYGPGKKARHGPIGVHTRMIENALLGESTFVDHGGEERDDMIYVKDVAAGVVAACAASTLAHWVYNISTGRAVSLHDFADAVRANVPGAEITIGRGGDYLNLGPIYGVLSPDRAHRDLGFVAAYDLEAGVADFIESMHKLGLEPEAELEQNSWTTGGAVAGAS